MQRSTKAGLFLVASGFATLLFTSGRAAGAEVTRGIGLLLVVIGASPLALELHRWGEARRRRRDPQPVVSEPKARAEARQALETLAPLERRVCGKLILRQVERGPSIPREAAKYGPRACVRFCSARALQAYAYCLLVPTVAIAIAAPRLFLIAFAPMLVLFALAIMRIVSASQAGARWRASSPSDDGSAAEDLARRRRVLRATAITGAISGLLMLWTLLRPDHPHRSVSSLPVAVIAWVTVWAALWFALFAVWAMIAWLRRRRRSQ